MSTSKKKSETKPRKSAAARLLSSKVVYRGGAFWVTKDEVIEPHGLRVQRDVVRHTGSVVIMPVKNESGTTFVLLERQYRHAAQRYLWELPAGRIDGNEQELAAAKRELLEETGFTARKWKKILNFWASPGFVAETMSIFMASELRAGTAQPEADEVITSRFFPLKTAIGMVKNNTIRDAKTICGVLWLAQMDKSEKL